MSSNSPSSVQADLLLLTVTLVAAAGWIFSKEALAGLPPLLAAIRSVVGEELDDRVLFLRQIAG